ncbi:MAG: mechanosensitive ion channel [Desulfobacterales bacterium]|jgi:small-conductance mechanosensitive channel
MTNSTLSDKISTAFTSLFQGLRENFLQPIGFIQIGAIGVSYLVAWLLSTIIRKFLEKDIDRVRAHMHVTVSPAHFAIIFKYLFWGLLVWFCQALFNKFNLPVDVLHMVLNLIIAITVIRLASFYIKSSFWTYLVYGICLTVVALRIFKLWQPTVELLNSMTIGLGKISISVWGLIESIIVFILLWIAAGAANRFIAHWLTASKHLTYSDRTLLQRVIRAAMVTVVILISLNAAGIHMAAIAVTGGAIGFAVGIGLQKIGSNLVSGIMLLYRKPIRQGDVIAFKKDFAGVRWGWIADIGLMYVKVATRSGSLLLIPNEIFVTQQIENLSFDDDRIRLNIPFGLAYESDLNKARALALSAAGSIDRILKIPEPKCLVLGYGESTVNMELRVWIEDPKNGIRNVKDAVLMAVWDNFHDNGITIAFPQRDLHIKSAVPLKISGS